LPFSAMSAFAFTDGSVPDPQEVLVVFDDKRCVHEEVFRCEDLHRSATGELQINQALGALVVRFFLRHHTNLKFYHYRFFRLSLDLLFELLHGLCEDVTFLERRCGFQDDLKPEHCRDDQCE